MLKFLFLRPPENLNCGFTYQQGWRLPTGIACIEDYRRKSFQRAVADVIAALLKYQWVTHNAAIRALARAEGKDRSFNIITANWVMTQFAVILLNDLSSFSPMTSSSHAQLDWHRNLWHCSMPWCRVRRNKTFKVHFYTECTDQGNMSWFQR